MSKDKPTKSLVTFQAEDRLQEEFERVFSQYGLKKSFVLRQLMKLYIKKNGDMKLIIHEEKQPINKG